MQVRLKWQVVAMPLELLVLAVLNYHQHGLAVAAAKYLFTGFLSLLAGFYLDRTARVHCVSTTYP